MYVCVCMCVYEEYACVRLLLHHKGRWALSSVGVFVLYVGGRVCEHVCVHAQCVYVGWLSTISECVFMCVRARTIVHVRDREKHLCGELIEWFPYVKWFVVCQMVCCLLVFVEVRVHMCAHISETLCMHCTCLCMRLNDHSTFHKKQTPQKSPKLTSQFIVSHSTTLVQFFWFPSNLLMYCEIPKTLRIFFVDFRRFILSGISRSCVSRDSPNCACLAIFVISPKLQVSFAKEPYKRDYILQKRPMILRSLLDSLDISWFFALPHHIMYQSIYSACA